MLPAVRSAAEDRASHRWRPRLAELRQWVDTVLRGEYGGCQLPECGLSGLARRMGMTYRKPVIAPLIAERLSDRIIEQFRPVLMPRLDLQEASAEQDGAADSRPTSFEQRQ